MGVSTSVSVGENVLDVPSRFFLLLCFVVKDIFKSEYQFGLSLYIFGEIFVAIP